MPSARHHSDLKTMVRMPRPTGYQELETYLRRTLVAELFCPCFPLRPPLLVGRCLALHAGARVLTWLLALAGEDGRPALPHPPCTLHFNASCGASEPVQRQEDSVSGGEGGAKVPAQRWEPAHQLLRTEAPPAKRRAHVSRLQPTTLARGIKPAGMRQVWHCTRTRGPRYHMLQSGQLTQ